MALPEGFLDANDFFVSAVKFLSEYAWIYQYSNVDIIKAGILDRLSSQFSDYFINLEHSNLNVFPCVNTNFIEIDYVVLKNFRDTVKKLIPSIFFNNLTSDPDRPNSTFFKVSMKKQHEVLRLSKFINQQCSQNDLLIDFGSGLGYLSEALLESNKNFSILGLESDVQRIQRAQQRIGKNTNRKNKILYEQEHITEQSQAAILKYVKKLKDQQNVDWTSWNIIGLHSCADLSITSINMFFNIENVQRLIIVPCCYHRMQSQNSCFGNHKNFPLSNTLKSIVQENRKDDFIFNTHFLRLACQQTTARWRRLNPEEYKSRGQELYWRAVAEAILDDEEYVKKVKSQNTDIKSFDDFGQLYNLKSKKGIQQLQWSDQHRTRFEFITHKYGQTGYKIVLGLLCLQETLQKLCENIVLYDRVVFMEETAISKQIRITVQHEKLFDEILSPRCFVLHAKKL